MHPSYMVSGLNATDKTAMCEMPLIYVFGDWVLGLGRAFIVLVFSAMAFCPEIKLNTCSFVCLYATNLPKKC